MFCLNIHACVRDDIFSWCGGKFWGVRFSLGPWQELEWKDAPRHVFHCVRGVWRGRFWSSVPAGVVFCFCFFTGRGVAYSSSLESRCSHRCMPVTPRLTPQPPRSCAIAFLISSVSQAFPYSPRQHHCPSF